MAARVTPVPMQPFFVYFSENAFDTDKNGIVWNSISCMVITNRYPSYCRRTNIFKMFTIFRSRTESRRLASFAKLAHVSCLQPVGCFFLQLHQFLGLSLKIASLMCHRKKLRCNILR